MQIDFLICHNRYGTASHFSKKLGEALERLGVHIRFFDISQGNFYKAFYAIQEDPPDLTCSFSDVTLGEKAPLGPAWGICHLSFFLDHAAYFLHQLTPNYSMVASICEEDVAFMHELGYKNAFFFPHATQKSLETASKSRRYDLAFFGSCIDFENIALKWKKKYSPKVVEMLHAASEEVLYSGISCLRALANFGIEEELPLYHQEVENFVRGKERLHLLQSLDSNALHIWGEGNWKKFLPRATLHKKIPFHLALKKMQESKIVLNSMPTLRHGLHERVVSAPMNGALCISTENSYLQKEFEQSFVGYRYGKWSELGEKIDFYLKNENERHDLVSRARKIILERHTWDVRAEQLIAFIPVFLVQERAGGASVHTF